MKAGESRYNISFHGTLVSFSCIIALTVLVIIRGVSVFSSPEHGVLMVSYCDQSVSVVCRASSTVCFKS